MRKQFISTVLCLCLIFGLAAQTAAPEAQALGIDPAIVSDFTPIDTVLTAATDEQGKTNFRVNGAYTAQNLNMSTHNQTTYVSLRDMAQALRPGIYVEWNGTRAMVWAENLHLTAVPGDRYIVANGRYLYVPEGIKLEKDAVMVPVRVLAKALDATVTWDAIGGISVTTGSGALKPAEQFYNSDDLYWLSRIICAESGNQPLVGQIAVGNVIMNRVAAKNCPNTIKGVIFQRGQFQPVQNGSVYNTPYPVSVIAAKLVLDGAVAIDNAMFFCQSRLGGWMARSRPYVATIGAHAFYA
ncbi:MAG: cell wall hydrolase [Oscillospiraceae bacterium]